MAKRSKPLYLMTIDGAVAKQSSTGALVPAEPGDKIIDIVLGDVDCAEAAMCASVTRDIRLCGVSRGPYDYWIIRTSP